MREEKIIDARSKCGPIPTINIGIEPGYPKIGVGVTTHNRRETFNKTYSQIMSFLPTNAFVAVVDDCSKEGIDFAVHNTSIQTLYRFDQNVGIARAKNKALELLYNAGCEHFFLFDDDTYPIVDNWWRPYIESQEPHLMYIFQHFANAPGPNDMIKIYQDDEIAAYSHVRGCMLYYKRICLDTVGGMDTVFGKWGNEHGDLSNRIYSAGLTRFRYMDVANSRGLFYAADEQEHGKFVSTVPGHQRIELLNKTKPIYDAHYNMPIYCEFREKKKSQRIDKQPLFLSALLTEQPDPQRPGHKWEMNQAITNDYIDSVFHINGLVGDNIILYDGTKLDGLDALYRTSKWIHTASSINPYFQRWISYYEYLIKHREEISWVFMTDCTDVELLKMPEPERGKIYVGDEPGSIKNGPGATWLQFHHKHPILQRFYQHCGGHQMVNAGILGGYIDEVLPFIRAIIDTYTQMMHESTRNPKIPGPGMTDMGVFNYVAISLFGDKISHGKHVNTTFKANERNEISWFKHK